MLVSICVLTYNHERFVGETLDSILQQKTQYPYEILIFEDASTDATLSILKKYQAQYPDVIKIFSSPQNIGHFRNLREKFKYAQGEYVCLLDGDDRWCADDKVQRQIDFLEKNPTFVGVAHNVMCVSGVKKKPMSRQMQPKSYDIFDILSARVYFHTSSLMHRNIFRGQFPECYYSPQAGDWFLSMLYAEHGPIFYFPEVMSIYRFHGAGLWSGLKDSQRRKANLEAALAYDRLFDYKYSNYLIFSMGVKSLLLRHWYELSFADNIRFLKLLISTDIKKLLIRANAILGVGDKDMALFLKRR